MKMLNIPKLAPIRLRRNCHILFHPYSVLFLPLTPAYFKDRFLFLHAPITEYDNPRKTYV